MQCGQCLKNVLAFLSKKGCSMILKSSKLWSRLKISSIWAIEQVSTIKIVGSTTHFILLGTQVPLLKWAGNKYLRKNLWFRTIFVSTLFWNVKFGLGPGQRVIWYIGGISWLLAVEMSSEKKLRKNLGSWTSSVFYSIFKSQILNHLMTQICRCDTRGKK